MSLRIKILIVILTVSTLMFGLLIGYIGHKTNKSALSEANKQFDASSKAFANKMSAQFDYQIGICETYIQSISYLDHLPLEQRKEEASKLEMSILQNNPHILAVWSSWNLNTIDSLWYNDYGRQTIGLYNNKGTILPLEREPIDTTGENISPNFTYIKKNKTSYITEPYKVVFGINDTDSLSMVSIIGPILTEETFNGIGGIDLNLEDFKILINQVKFPFNEGFAFFISNEGKFITYNKPELIGKNIISEFKDEEKIYHIKKNIKKGNQIKFKTTLNHVEVLVTFAPIQLTNIKRPWAVGMIVPLDTIMHSANKEFKNTIIVASFSLLIFIILAIWLSKFIIKPLTRIHLVLENISKGQVSDLNKITIFSKDEIGRIVKATNTLIDKMSAIAKFSAEIGKGNLHANYKVENKNDNLGYSILEMQKSLIVATEENDKRKEEDRRVNWTTTGIAKFSELLRQNSNDIEEFSYIIISNLVEYLEANQGAVFLINDKNKNNQYIEKKGAYAYSHRKYEEQSFEMGVGLVGRCVLEKQTIYLTDIPTEYIKITSGLGEETPRCLALIPLKYNDIIYGVIEVASFKNIEQYQITFLEKIGESIASSISSIKINSQTAKLLDESQMQSEMLSSQEEEMRQNLEEMRATQEQLQDAVEQSKNKEIELTSTNENLQKSIEAYERLIDSINYPIYYKDLNGKYLSCNTAYAEVLGFDKNEIVGRTDFQFLTFEEAQAFEAVEKRIIKEKLDETQKVLFNTKAGEVFNGLQNKKALYNKANRLIGTITILVPINVIDVLK